MSLILSHPVGYLILWIVLFGIILFTGRKLAPLIDDMQNHQMVKALVIISASVSILIAISIIVGAYRIANQLNYSAKGLKIALLPVFLLFVLTVIGVRSYPSSALLIMLNGTTLVVFAFLLGELMSREVIHPGHLIPVAAVLALVDFWSVGQGPSKEIAQQIGKFAESGGYTGEVAPPLQTFLLLRFPQFITREIYSFVGIGDLVILAFFSGCITRFRLSIILSNASLIAGPVLAVLIANILGQAIPALPVIAILFILVNVRYLTMQKKDINISLIVIVAIILIISLLVLLR